tara:strand:+ start:621 stop:854 length:234 start_codon:yes stop_codon:yes gene_type:complete
MLDLVGLLGYIIYMNKTITQTNEATMDKEREINLAFAEWLQTATKDEQEPFWNIVLKQQPSKEQILAVMAAFCGLKN